MPPILAAALFCAFSYWLIRRDVERHPEVSRASWIPWLWLIIISSRSITVWLGLAGSGSGDANSEGTPLDRLVYSILICMGLVVLSRRRVSLGRFVSANGWLAVFFLFWAISILWSDYSFIAFKRWIKDTGNIVMVLILLTEREPVTAVKAVFLRCAYLLIPISVLFIKYYPDLGRVYNRWSWQYMYVGVAQQKNSLGCLVMISGLFLLWDYLALRKAGGLPKGWKNTATRWSLFAMILWLMQKANSSTSLVCLLLGVAILLAFELQLVQRSVRAFGAYIVLGTLTFLFLDSIFNLRSILAASVGRDTTFTTRVDIWALVLEQPINSWVGTGFYSFWMGSRLEAVQSVFEGINQAHNGYLETYLNGGYIGVALLVLWLIASYVGIQNALVRGSHFARLRFVIWLAVIFYNFTEAAFDRLGIIWLTMLVATIEYPQATIRRAPSAYRERVRETAREELVGAGAVAAR